MYGNNILNILGEEAVVRAVAVYLIVKGDSEEAIQLLSRYYKVETPKLRVGLPRRCLKALGCYVSGKKTIYVKSSREYSDPFTILHEYYHHLRSLQGKHRGTEKNANLYALESIKYYEVLRRMGIMEEITSFILDKIRL